MAALSDPTPPGPPLAKQRLVEWFWTSPWWHKVLVLAPLLLVFPGSLLGALTGLLLAWANQSVLRSRLDPAPKFGICLLVIVFGGGLFLVADEFLKLWLLSTLGGAYRG